MIKPAFLVEGDLEQKFIQSVCPGSPVQKINCNGDRVEISAIAKRVGTLGRLLQKRFRPLIVVFDREKRNLSCDEIELELRECLKSEDLNVETLIGIPDREIENWILADFETFIHCSGCDEELNFEAFEGTSGKSKIKSMLPSGKAYVETVEGVAWLKQCRAKKLAERSPSFAKLATILQPLQCWWLDDIKLL